MSNAEGEPVVNHTRSDHQSKRRSENPVYAAVTGWGFYAPKKVLTNHQLAEMVDTTDEWIRSRTGIRERHIAAPEESTSTMCVAAARQALAIAGLSPFDLDLILCATTTPDQLMPATACAVQRDLGAVHAGAFDLNAACTGFLSAFITGSQFIQAGTFRRILVVSGETLSRFLNWKDRGTCVLFGDGAGAIVLEASEEESGLISFDLGCNGADGKLLTIEAGGSARPATATTVQESLHCVAMQGRDIFKFAVRAMAQAGTRALAQAGIAPETLRAVIAHQANERIIRATQEAMGLPWEKFYVNVDRFGNTGSAALAIALAEFLGKGPIQAGDEILLTVFGGGLTWAAAVYRHANVTAVVQQRKKLTVAN
jgi:3-oxoacyl-[acyl-carrier-protein] synthase III